MGGDGKIGGGGSCWINFLVADGKPMGQSLKRLHAFDVDAKDGDVITVKFLRDCTQVANNKKTPVAAGTRYEVTLGPGACIEISWPPKP